MKKIIRLFFIIISNFLFCQTEQISLNFFAENLLPKLKNTIVYFDGKVIDKVKFKNQKQSNHILLDYLYSEDDRRDLSNKKSDFVKKFDYDEVKKFANIINSTAKNLIVPKNLKFRKELKTKEWKAGKLRNKINQIFPQKFNLKISPSIQIDENTYITRIFINKQNDAYGSYFDIVTNKGEIIDWVETSWVQ